MNTPNKLASAIALIIGTGTPFAHAATPPVGSVLTITTGTGPTDMYGTITNVTSGSWFGMDNSGESKISANEKTVLAQGTAGIVIGMTTNPGASHTGLPISTDTNQVDAPWGFFGNTGSDYLTEAVTGSTTAGLNFSGWTVTWNSIPAIPMNARAWQPGNCSIIGCDGLTFSDGNAHFSWDGTENGTYVINYSATVPIGDPSGFGNVQYYLHLEGTVTNDAPVALPRTVNTSVGGTATWTPGASDPNPTANGGNGFANTDITCSIPTQPANGTATIENDCSSGSYTHNGGASTSDSFTYVVDDGLSTTSATVTVNISNDPFPNAADFSANAVGTTSIDFAANASDTPPGSVNPASLSVTCTLGTIASNGDGTATYTAPANFAGSDTCEYTVADDAGQTSAPGTATILVSPTTAGSSNGTLSGGETSSVASDAETSQQCIGGCFDFTVSGLTQGASTRVVLPLSEPIPTGAVYRKYIINDAEWVTFTPDASNNIATAARITVNGQSVCPAANSTNYTTSIVAGNECVRLTLQDGGPYDNDATPGQIRDPGGIGIPGTAPIPPSGSSGCTLSSTPRNVQTAADWWLVGLLLGGLGLLRRRVASRFSSERL